MPAVFLYRFFARRRFLLFIITFLITALFVFYGKRLSVEEDITKFIPRDEKTEAINLTLKNLKVRDKLLISISGSLNGDGPQKQMECAQELSDSLSSRYGQYISDIVARVSEERQAGLYSIFNAHLPSFLDYDDLKRIENTISPDSVAGTMESNYKTLLSPSGVVFGKFIKNDPLHFTGLALKKMQHLRVDENFEVSEGFIRSKDGRHLLLFVTPSIAPTQHKENKILIAGLDSIVASLHAKYNYELKIQYYGAGPVALGNSEQVRKDTLLTTVLALSLIAFVLLLYFRRPLVIFYILLPVAFGISLSLCALYFINSEVSAIALGAGSIVLGIAINYSLHFFTHRLHARSVEEVIGDLTGPMLLGCVTTVAAFFSLLFAKSQALHDFGLFSGFSLIGAVLFSIIVLPHFLSRTTEPHHPSGFQKKLEGFLAHRFHKNKFLVSTVILSTFVLLYFAPRAGFESNMMGMNYQSADLQEAQATFDTLLKVSHTPVYVVARGKDLETVLRLNDRIASEMEALKKEGVVSKFAGMAQVMPSDSLQQKRIQDWKKFWTQGKKDSLRSLLKVAGGRYKFKPSAFDNFLSGLEKEYQPLSGQNKDSLVNLVGSEYFNHLNNELSVLTVVQAVPEKKAEIYSRFSGQPAVLVFDRRHLTEQFVEVISEDFNLILSITALLVFSFMLLSHGRIELAIINFLPMLVSWIWILGIMALLGIQFNIINIIISTFIFGLGDDYSIFILDGLSHEYKYGKQNLASYKTSIFLSALTNIIGIGVLIFAEHPALRSIAAISIIGLCSVLLISFVLQPLVYEFLILSRRRRGLLPYTASNLLISATGFVIFVIASLLLTLFTFLLFNLLPIATIKKQNIVNRIIQVFCRMMIYLFAHVRKNIINQHGEKLSKPAVMIANHQSHIDLALILMLHPRIVVFTNDWVWNSPFYGYLVRKAGYYRASEGYEKALESVRQKMAQGYSVLIFPEGTRSITGQILRFHKGAFFLSEQTGAELLPILIHGAGDVLTKGDFHLKKGSITMKILQRIPANDHRYGVQYSDRGKAINRMMRHEYALLKTTTETTAYFRPLLIRNYIYKGPVMEWYCRIKTKLEENYRLLDDELPESGKITDIGCGYGFLSLMLSFRSPARIITGIDYDEEKIAIASNCVSKSENVNFTAADVTRSPLRDADAFIINDVLHYLEPREQADLLERCVASLRPGGTMIIRDGDADKKTRHQGTRYTEFFSTGTGFNKTKSTGLHFLNAAFIRECLDKFDFLSYRLIDDTRYTSNITFIVKRKSDAETV